MKKKSELYDVYKLINGRQYNVGRFYGKSVRDACNRARYNDSDSGYTGFPDGAINGDPKGFKYPAYYADKVGMK